MLPQGHLSATCLGSSFTPGCFKDPNRPPSQLCLPFSPCPSELSSCHSLAPKPSMAPSAHEAGIGSSLWQSRPSAGYLPPLLQLCLPQFQADLIPPRLRHVPCTSPGPRVVSGAPSSLSPGCILLILSSPWTGRLPGRIAPDWVPSSGNWLPRGWHSYSWTQLFMPPPSQPGLCQPRSPVSPGQTWHLAWGRSPPAASGWRDDGSPSISLVGSTGHLCQPPSELQSCPLIPGACPLGSPLGCGPSFSFPGTSFKELPLGGGGSVICLHL